MDIACSPTSCLILTLLLWGLTAFMAVKGESYSPAGDEQGGEPRRSSRSSRRARRSLARTRVRTRTAPAAESGPAF